MPVTGNSPGPAMPEPTCDHCPRPIRVVVLLQSSTGTTTNLCTECYVKAIGETPLTLIRRLPRVLRAVFLAALLGASGLAHAGSYPMSCAADPTATQYVLEMSQDNGVTWATVKTATTCAFTITTPTDAPDNKLLLFRYVAKNAAGTTYRSDAGHFVNTGWKAPLPPAALGVQ